MMYYCSKNVLSSVLGGCDRMKSIASLVLRKTVIPRPLLVNYPGFRIHLLISPLRSLMTYCQLKQVKWYVFGIFSLGFIYNF